MDDIELLDVGNKLGNKPKDTETLVNETSGRYEDFSQESHAVSTRVLDRYLNFIPTVAFSVNLQSSWESFALTFQAGLLNGGPTSLVYGTIVAWLGSMAIAASLGEMASVNPTVGAQYRWAAKYAPRGLMTPAFWGLIQGWITVLAWVSGCAQDALLIATTIQGLIIFNAGTYVPHAWHGTLLAWAVLIVPFLVNTFARQLLPPFQVIGGICHLVFWMSWIVVLVILAPRSPASFVFGTNIYGPSGWSNKGVQWCLGLLSATSSFSPVDGVLHMADEVKDAPKKLPLAMLSSLAINGIMALAFNITVLFCLGPLDTAMATPTGFPIIQVMYGATQSKAATTFLVSGILFNGMVVQSNTLASVSRLTWAFANDKGLPCSKLLGAVHRQLRIPLNSLLAVGIGVFLLQLINIGSTTAFYAILSLTTIALYDSYIISIGFLLYAKLRGEKLVYGPFKLGLYGVGINAFAIVFALFILVWQPLPSDLPVTAENMNYGGPVLAIVVSLALLDWFVSGHKRFKVPKENVYEQ